MGASESNIIKQGIAADKMWEKETKRQLEELDKQGVKYSVIGDEVLIEVKP